MTIIIIEISSHSFFILSYQNSLELSLIYILVLGIELREIFLKIVLHEVYFYYVKG